VSFRGEFERDTTNSFNNFQDGAVKNYADQGGIRSNTIASITKAATAVLTIAEPQWSLREGPVKSISGVTGMTQLNGNIVYLKITGLQTAELYSDAALTTPINSTSFGTYVSGGTISGVYGPKFIWGVFAKKQFAPTTTVEMAVSINWKEIVQ
jgi:hypothetical protein